MSAAPTPLARAVQTLPEQAMTLGSLLEAVDPVELCAWATINAALLRSQFMRLGYERAEFPLFVRIQYVYCERLCRREQPAPVSTPSSPCRRAQEQELGPASGFVEWMFELARRALR